ncbi:hypothetical protein IQ268_27530 [Oculatella sp. LEGE 06141]|uniref:hypothetical protein n=1 Tax=Oculatella sp. LEGE 06141 TaxID=1828648 RepID=UPI001880F461|nr:hypothetical protein [Oculatella sp. LEGE 06141]MBE9182305.1 hypothetical protein [Oculatella sp. LEGE 06141]
MSSQNLEHNKPNRPRTVKLGAIALAAAGLLLAACETDPQTTDPAASPQPQAQEEVTSGDVTDNTEDYIGQTVTVRGDVEETIGENAFRMSDNQFLGGDILVISETGTVQLPEDGIPVQVTGEVRQFQGAELQQQFNLTLDENEYSDYEDRPVIVAQSIAPAPEPGDISDNPDQFYGQAIALRGDVDEIFSPEAFRVSEGIGDGILVLGTTTPAPAIEDGQRVAVVGELRPFNASEIQQQYNLDWDQALQDQLQAEYDNQAVLVAEEVYPIDEQGILN